MDTEDTRAFTYEQFERFKNYMSRFFTLDPTGRDNTEKLCKISKMKSDIINQISVEREILIDLKNKLDQNKAIVQDDIKKHSNLYDTKNEILIKMNGDPRITKISLEINKRELYIEYLLEQKENLKEFLYSLKYHLDYRRFENGE